MDVALGEDSLQYSIVHHGDGSHAFFRHGLDGFQQPWRWMVPRPEVGARF